VKIIAVFETVPPHNSGRILSKLRRFVYEDAVAEVRGATFFEVADGDPSEAKLGEMEKQMRFLGTASND